MEAMIRYAAARARADYDDGTVTLAQSRRDTDCKSERIQHADQITYVYELAELGAFDAAEAFARAPSSRLGTAGAWIQIAIVLARRSDPRLNRVLGKRRQMQLLSKIFTKDQSRYVHWHGSWRAWATRLREHLGADGELADSANKSGPGSRLRQLGLKHSYGVAIAHSGASRRCHYAASE